MEEIRTNEIINTEENECEDLTVAYDSDLDGYSEAKSGGSGVLGVVGGLAILSVVGFGAYKLGKKVVGKAKTAKENRKKYKEWLAEQEQTDAGTIEAEFDEVSEIETSDEA